MLPDGIYKYYKIDNGDNSRIHQATIVVIDQNLYITNDPYNTMKTFFKQDRPVDRKVEDVIKSVNRNGYGVFIRQDQEVKKSDWTQSYLLHKSEEQPTTLIHYSRTPGLTEINPKQMGTSGVKSGGQYKYFNPSTIADYPHTSFYYKKDEPEDIVKQGSASKYTVTLEPHQKLYDLSHDKDGLVKQAVQENQGVWNTQNVFQKIKDAGYHGIHVTSPEAHPVIQNTVQIFHPHKPDKEEGV